ncbi:PREDICTED: subtilisin-like protease SBT1.4 [Tarenaya hassleriana]|uniref:subtilisin-like protease SBT1.4 n=1 Tax=Tarenaya hassleriana TaxID=28532 RepID=UPI00053C4ED6|nr:PREDICTED: subtilisin-like protease SBT1.4 [Tarenaya hassleriana]
MAMAKLSLSSSIFLSLSLFFCLFSATSSSDASQATFIVHVSRSQKPSLFSSHHHWHSSILRSLPPSPRPATLIYSYSRAVNGFSAVLSPSQVAFLRLIPAVISVIPDRIHQIHTTHTPRFLGFSGNFSLWSNSDDGEDVIVGVLDTGIWPEHPSFSDSGLGPVPSSWKGACEIGPDFPASACSRKLIGARAFYKGYESHLNGSMDDSKESKSPRDTEGHGTHTASTAAGSVVANASLYQYARGEARGMASKARIAAYKICWSSGCYDSDILAAMDQAVSDGVQVISLSVGANGLAPAYHEDSIAIGAFGAAQHGVVVSCSAGNSGPGPYTAVNIAPWILTVGASTIDREFPADAVIGDGRVFYGTSLYAGEDSLSDSQIPLVYSGDCGSRLCYPGKLNSSLVKGKIVLCDRGGNARVEKGSAVKQAGGLGMILANTDESGEELTADSHLIPATMVGSAAGNQIRDYIKISSESPTATIRFEGTVIGPSPSAPRVAAFSSRGPNHLTPQILKPDVIAPGVNILAGWTGSVGPTDLDIDPRRVTFNIISGTSMSCPHVSGLAALLRKAHPNWSPAMIKSALVTTAYNVDNSGESIKDLATGKSSNPFIHGAGHVDPNKALDPGLVYDIDMKEYVAFLCAVGYDWPAISVFIHDPKLFNACETSKLRTPGDLNYPSLVAVLGSSGEVVKYRRVVKNVGSKADAVYNVGINSPTNVEIEVSPSRLEFSKEKRELEYEVTFRSVVLGGRVGAEPREEFGSIEWTDGDHVVRSPVAIRWSQGSVQPI